MRENPVPRRNLLLGAVGATGVAATGGAWLALGPEETGRVGASSPAVQRAEDTRRAGGSGRTVSAAVTAEVGEVDLGGHVVRTWTYDGRIPGPAVRCRAGDQLEVDVTNRLPEPTTLHWHGLQLRNDMDGVPHLTQRPIAPAESMRYTFVAPDPGTYWFHPHVGLQRERGLFAPLIVDDPADPGDYDAEFVVVLDDWIDGIGATPDDVLTALLTGGAGARYEAPVQAGRITDESANWQYHLPPGLAGAPPGTPSAAARLASSVDFPYYLLNGRLPTAPPTFRAEPGRRARIRLINAAGATVFRVALGGHQLTVTHTDGFPVEPVTVDTLQVGSGERYDLLVTLDDGAFPLVAVAEGKRAQALGIVRTAAGPAPPATAAPAELSGRLLALSDMRAAPAVRRDPRAPDVTRTLYLTGDMNTFAWRINAETYHHDRPFDGITPTPLREGQQVRLELVNQTPMYHPMHVHGHTFTVGGIGDYRDLERTHDTVLPDGARKDTVMVAPGERITIDFAADNPGQWLTHCHNAYHMATGMAAVLSYRSR